MPYCRIYGFTALRQTITPHNSMTKEERYSNIPATLLPKIAAYAKVTEQKARGVCQRHNVTKEAADALIADVEDLLHGHYYPMHATTEQMRLLCKNVSPKSWDKTDNAALGLMAMYYRDIVATLDGVHVNFSSVTAFLNLWAVSLREAVRRAVTEDGELLDGVAINDEEYDSELLEEQAQRLYYTYCVQIIGERTDATEDELRAIDSIVEYDDRRKERCISMALDMRQQHKRIEETEQKRRAERKKKGEDYLPTLYGDNKPLTQWLNFVLTEGRGLQTANVLTTTEQNTQWQPVRLQIEAKAKRAEAIMNSKDATDREKKEAAQLVATRTAVMQAVEFLQILPQIFTPNSGSASYSEYVLTPREITKYCLNTDNPNNTQIETTLRGFLFLSTQRMQIEERLRMKTKEKDAEGKPVYVTKTKVTNFQPLVIKLQSEYEDDVLIENATKVTLRIDKTIETGRSAEHIKEGKQNYYIQQQERIYTTAEQMAAFHKTAQEITFLRLVQSLTHCDEETLLTRVFDYQSQQTILNNQKAAARRAVEVLKANREATTYDIQQAESEAAAAEQQARYHITKHKERDVKLLTTWFERAVKMKVIAEWQRKEPNKTKAKYGAGYVWEWQKTPTKAEQKEQKRRQKAALKGYLAAAKASKQRIKEMR